MNTHLPYLGINYSKQNVIYLMKCYQERFFTLEISLNVWRSRENFKVVLLKTMQKTIDFECIHYAVSCIIILLTM